MVGSLGLVVVIQQIHRSLGASAAILWLVALGAFGGNALGQGQKVQFVGIEVPNWLFAGFTLGLLTYNGWVLYRSVRSRRTAPPATESAESES